jgi:hypothetical protein
MDPDPGKTKFVQPKEKRIFILYFMMFSLGGLNAEVYNSCMDVAP